MLDALAPLFKLLVNPLSQALARQPLDPNPAATWSDTSVRLRLNSLAQKAITQMDGPLAALIPALTTFSDRRSDGELRQLGEAIAKVGAEMQAALSEDDSRVYREIEQGVIGLME
jgi:hypothetical protein